VFCVNVCLYICTQGENEHANAHIYNDLVNRVQKHLGNSMPIMEESSGCACVCVWRCVEVGRMCMCVPVCVFAFL